MLFIITFFHFSGFDRFMIVLVENYFMIEWAWQSYVVIVFAFIGLIGFSFNYIALILVSINLAIIPFNFVSAFINRVGAGYFFSFCGSFSYKKNVKIAIILGATVGSALILFEGVMLALVRDPWALSGKGMFTNPSFSLTATFSLLLLRGKKLKGWHFLFCALLVISSIISGARVTIAITIILTIYYFRHKSIIVFLISLMITLMLYLLPYSSNLVAVNKMLFTFSEIYVAAEQVMRSQEKFESQVTTEVQPTSASERLAGLHSLRGAMPGLLLPLRADIKPDDVGHIGLILYISNYGIILLLFVVFLSLKILPAREFLILFTLSLFFTDPILTFGVGLALLRLADPQAPTFNHGKWRVCQ